MDLEGLERTYMGCLRKNFTVKPNFCFGQFNPVHIFGILEVAFCGFCFGEIGGLQYIRKLLSDKSYILHYNDAPWREESISERINVIGLLDQKLQREHYLLHPVHPYKCMFPL
jgi:hypothetical protein